MSNGQFFFQKPEGLFQYFVQVGAYTIPSLGTPYVNTHEATGDFSGPLPVAYLYLAPTSTFSIEGGKLPTLIGAGYTFSFQNPNIEHSLLWNQEPAVSRGGQLNYTAGPVALSFSLNDGFYSNRYTWLTGSATYTLDSANKFTLFAGGNYAHTTKSTLATSLFQNNETILNLIYIHNSAPWAFATGLQFTRVPTVASIGVLTSASTAGGGLLVNYSFGDNSPLRGVALPVRLEYISSTGSLADGAPNLYGPGQTRGQSRHRRRPLYAVTVGAATVLTSKARAATMVVSGFGLTGKWKSRLTNGAMKTQTYAQNRIGEVLEVTATIPMTPEREVARGLVWAGT